MGSNPVFGGHPNQGGVIDARDISDLGKTNIAIE